MKATLVLDTPTQKVIERSKLELFYLRFEAKMVTAAMIGPAVSMASLIGIANGDPTVIATALSLGTASFVAITRGKTFNGTIRELAGVDTKKKELQNSLNEGEKIQLGETRYTKNPNAFIDNTGRSEKFLDKRLSSHEVKSYVKKLKGKLIFENVITELPLNTWDQTFTELVNNSGLEKVDVSSHSLPTGTSYFECQSKGTLDEYKAKLDVEAASETES